MTRGVWAELEDVPRPPRGPWLEALLFILGILFVWTVMTLLLQPAVVFAK